MEGAKIFAAAFTVFWAAGVLAPASAAPARASIDALFEEASRQFEGREPSAGAPDYSKMTARQVVADLEWRLAAESKTLAEISDSEERRLSAARIAQWRGILAKLSAAEDRPLAPPSRIVAAAGEDGPRARERFEAVLNRGRSSAREDSAEIARLFDNMRSRPPLDAAVLAMEAEGELKDAPADFASPLLNPGLDRAWVPAADAQAIPPPAGIWDKLERSARAGISPFSSLTVAGRRSLFLSERAALRTRLSASAAAAIVEGGGAPGPTMGDLAAADAAAMKRGTGPMAELHRSKRALYTAFLQAALADRAVPPGTVFEPWELGFEGDAVLRAVVAEVADRGRSFYGLRREFADGTTRFEAIGAAGGLVVVGSPADAREIRTRVTFDAEDRPSETRTEIIDTDTGRRIREEIVSMARSLTTLIDYDSAGAAATEEVLDGANGTRTVTDRKSGTRVTAGKDGSFSLLEADGRLIRYASPGVIRVTKDGKLIGHQAVLDSLFDNKGTPAGREKEAARLSREIVKALGYDDARDRRSRPLNSWLAGMWSKDERFTDASLTIDPEGEFRLVYSLSDGTKRIERARYGLSSSYRGGPRTLALVLLTPAHTDRDGRWTPDPKRYTEFLASGDHNQWHTTIEFQEAGWFSSAKTIRHVSLNRYRRAADGAWRRLGSEKKDEIVEEVGGSSTFGIIGSAIHDAPVVGHVLKAGEAVGKSLYTGLMAAPQEIVYAVTGDTRYGLEASGSWAKNPAMGLLVDDQGHLDRLSPEMWDIVVVKAGEMRREDLRRLGYTEENSDPAEFRKMAGQWRGSAFATRAECERLYARRTCDRYMYSSEELVRAVKGYGAFTFGDRLIDSAQGTEGLEYAARVGGGWGFKVFENVGETVFNPVVWATFGLGRGVQALTALRAAGTGARFLPAAAVPAALSTARVTHAVLNTTMGATWALSGAESIGQLAIALKEGDGRTALDKSAQAASDLFFLWMMRRGSKSEAARLKAKQAILERQGALSADYRAALASSAKNGRTPRLRPTKVPATKRAAPPIKESRLALAEKPVAKQARGKVEESRLALAEKPVAKRARGKVEESRLALAEKPVAKRARGKVEESRLALAEKPVAKRTRGKVEESRAAMADKPVAKRTRGKVEESRLALAEKPVAKQARGKVEESRLALADKPVAKRARGKVEESRLALAEKPVAKRARGKVEESRAAMAEKPVAKRARGKVEESRLALAEKPVAKRARGKVEESRAAMADKPVAKRTRGKVEESRLALAEKPVAKRARGKAAEGRGRAERSASFKTAVVDAVRGWAGRVIPKTGFLALKPGTIAPATPAVLFDRTPVIAGREVARFPAGKAASPPAVVVAEKTPVLETGRGELSERSEPAAQPAVARVAALPRETRSRTQATPSPAEMSSDPVRRAPPAAQAGSPSRDSGEGRGLTGTPSGVAAGDGGSFAGGGAASGPGSSGSGSRSGGTPLIDPGPAFDGTPAAAAKLTPSSATRLRSFQPLPAPGLHAAPPPFDPYRAGSRPDRAPKPAPRTIVAAPKAGGSLAPFVFLGATYSPGSSAMPEFKPAAREFPKERSAPTLPAVASAPSNPAPAAPAPAAEPRESSPGYETHMAGNRHSLRPSVHLVSGPVPNKEGSRDHSLWISLLLQITTLGAALLLFKATEFPFVLGLSRRTRA